MQNGGYNHTVGKEKMHKKFSKHSQISEDSIWLLQMPNYFTMMSMLIGLHTSGQCPWPKFENIVQ